MISVFFLWKIHVYFDFSTLPCANAVKLGQFLQCISSLLTL